jgi:hypothetical protein
MDKYEDMFNPSFLKNERPPIPKDATVTMAYIPLQEDLEVYESEKGLNEGTIFPVLNKKFFAKMVDTI